MSALSLKIATTVLALAMPQALEPPPNVVIIYGDDVGYADVGCYGSEQIPTPNIDRLASQGLRFTDGHCSAATCTPSRFSLLTGIHGFRHGVRVLPPNAPMTIKPGMFTLPMVFKAAGFETAVVGKWHLGIGDGENAVDWNGKVAPGPLEVGFDYSFLMPSTNDRVPCVYLQDHHVVGLDPNDALFVGSKPPPGFAGTVYPDGKQDPAAMTYYPSSHGHNNSVINGIGRIGFQWGGKAALWNDETMADVFVDQACAWLGERDPEQPFFLYFSSQDIHVPRAPHPRFQGKTGRGYRGDAMVQLDWATGAILDALEEHGLADNTLVIFSSDNGPVYDDGYVEGTTVRTSTQEVDRGHDASGPYRGGKYQIYEGGTRVPFIIRWPGRIEAGVSGALVNQIDLLASLATLLGNELTEEDAIDSRDTLAAFLGQDESGLPFMIEEARTLALREGNWKYIEGRGRDPKPEMYDLAMDVGEQDNRIAKESARAARMAARLVALKESAHGVRHEAARPPLPEPVGQSAQAKARPNIILLYADDAGYADFGFQLHTDVAMAGLTPHIDSIAAGGVRFSNAYMSGAVCSPSRAGLLTGRHQQRFGHERNIPPGYMQGGMSLGELTFADRLGVLDVATGMVGKWHLGYPADYHPNRRGFDWFHGLLQGSRSYFPTPKVSAHRVIQENGEALPEVGYVTDRFGEAAARYIREHRDEPFFLYVSFTAPHGPLQAKESDLELLTDIHPVKRRKYAGLVKAMDDAVGVILKTLEEQGLSENTLVVFTNDNGGQTQTGAINYPLRGRKGQLWEGGVRVPMAMRWPGKIPAGSVIDDPVISLDFLPTFVSVQGGRVDPEWQLDGHDLTPLLTGAMKELPARPLFWRNHGSSGAVSMRDGDFKLLIERDGPEETLHLFHLATDIGEEHNLAEEHPDRVQHMRAQITVWESELVEPLWGAFPAKKKAM